MTKENLQLNSIMLPEWLMFPEYQERRIFWRMGIGEQYIIEFQRWYRNLDKEKQLAWQEQFPVPHSWHYHNGDWEKSEKANHDQWFGFSDYYFIIFWRRHGEPKYSQKNNLEINAVDLRYTAKEKSSESMWYDYNYKSIFYMNSYKYHSLLQYIAAEKAKLFGDEKSFSKIMKSDCNEEINELNKNVANFSAELWNRCKYSVVLNGNYYKYITNVSLVRKLLSHYKLLQYKGYCNFENDSDLFLQLSLMEVMDEILRITKNISFEKIEQYREKYI